MKEDLFNVTEVLLVYPDESFVVLGIFHKFFALPVLNVMLEAPIEPLLRVFSPVSEHRELFDKFGLLEGSLHFLRNFRNWLLTDRHGMPTVIVAIPPIVNMILSKTTAHVRLPPPMVDVCIVIDIVCITDEEMSATRFDEDWEDIGAIGFKHQLIIDQMRMLESQLLL